MSKLGPAAAVAPPAREDVAYAAGFFDGEGNIVIAANKRGGARGRYLVYNMRIGASQNDVEPLLWLRHHWGGTVRCSKDGRHHYWQAFATGAMAFLLDVLPYLKVKRERALLAIEYQRRVLRRGRGGRSAEYLAWLVWVKAEMNRLNR